MLPLAAAAEVEGISFIADDCAAPWAIPAQFCDKHNACDLMVQAA